MGAKDFVLFRSTWLPLSDTHSSFASKHGILDIPGAFPCVMDVIVCLVDVETGCHFVLRKTFLRHNDMEVLGYGVPMEAHNFLEGRRRYFKQEIFDMIHSILFHVLAICGRFSFSCSCCFVMIYFSFV